MGEKLKLHEAMQTVIKKLGNTKPKQLTWIINNSKLYEKRDLMINELSKCGEIIGTIEHRLPNNICVRFDKYDGDYFVVLLNEMGICASSGSACSSGNGEPSHVILALGYSSENANSCIRFTLSKNNTVDEIHEVIEIVNEILNY